MKRKNASIQPDLFDQDEPRVLPVLSQKEQLATLVETLLLEIAAALVFMAGRGGGDGSVSSTRRGSREYATTPASMPLPLRHLSRKPRYSGGSARHSDLGVRITTPG